MSSDVRDKLLSQALVQLPGMKTSEVQMLMWALVDLQRGQARPGEGGANMGMGRACSPVQDAFVVACVQRFRGCEHQLLLQAADVGLGVIYRRAVGGVG
jgi:hypothetical protein